MTARRSGAGRWLACALVAWLAGAGCLVLRMPRFGELEPSSRPIELAQPLRLITIRNGMVVLLAPDDRTNLVTVDVRYAVGSFADPPGLTGLAHLVEHLTFEISSGGGGATIGDRLAALALTHNAYTNHDVTHYTSTALADRLDGLLELEAERLEAPCGRIDPARVARERDVVLAEDDERRTATTDVTWQVAAELWGPGHPYARPVGSREVATANPADVCAFLAQHYLPGNAVLVVTGAFDVDALAARVDDRFGSIDPAAAPAPAPTLAGPRLTGDTVEHRAPIDRPLVQIHLPAPPRGDPAEAAHDMALAALAIELAQLDRERDWVVDTDVDHVGDGRQRATRISIEVTDADRLDDAVDAVFARGRALFARTGDADVTAQVARHRRRLEARTVARLDAFEGRADWLADHLTYQRDPDLVTGSLRAADAVDWRQLRRHVDELFDRRRSHVVRILPSGESATASLGAGTGERTYDIVPWRAAIDPAEARRPLELAHQERPIVVDDRRLASGLRVVTYLDRRSPIVDARLIYPTGSVDESPAHPGVATLAAHLLDHDVRRAYPYQIAANLNWAFGVGTQIEVEVGEVATVFSARGLAVFGDWHVWRLSWLLDQGVYPARNLAVARQDLREAGDRDVSPATLAERERLFGRGHPYARPPVTVAQLAAIDRGMLARWRRDRFVPDGATLIVTGGFDPVAMEREIRDLFGPWPARPASPRPPVPRPHPQPGPSWLGVRVAGASQVKLSVAFAVGSTDDADRAARLVLAAMIDDRLRVVREGLGASYGVRAGYSRGAGGTALVVSTALDPARAAEAASAVLAELSALQADAGARPDAFARARRRVLARLLATERDASAVADALERLVRDGRDLDQLDELPAAVAGLTPDDVARLAAGDLDRRHMVVTVAGRAAAAAATLAAIGATEPTWFDEDD